MVSVLTYLLVLYLRTRLSQATCVYWTTDVEITVHNVTGRPLAGVQYSLDVYQYTVGQKNTRIHQTLVQIFAGY